MYSYHLLGGTPENPPGNREAIGGYPLDVVDQDGKGGGLDGTAWRIIPVSTGSS